MVEQSETDLKEEEWNGSINSVKDHTSKELRRLSK